MWRACGRAAGRGRDERSARGAGAAVCPSDPTPNGAHKLGVESTPKVPLRSGFKHASACRCGPQGVEDLADCRDDPSVTARQHGLRHQIVG
jgi:hypothetical protein